MGTRYRLAGALLVACVLGVVSVLASEQGPPGTAQEASDDAGAADTFMVLVPVRELRDIDRDIEAVEIARAAAVEAERSTLDFRAGTQSRILAKQIEIDTNKGKKDLAKREQRSAEVATLESEGAALKREKELLERRESLRDAELDLARKRAQFATLGARALQLERELAIKRLERVGFEGSRLNAASMDRVILDLEQATLQTLKDRADRESEVADREKKVVDRRLKILDAQRAIAIGG